jgi:DNA-binding NarL/FixJ family response regulator
MNLLELLPRTPDLAIADRHRQLSFDQLEHAAAAVAAQLRADVARFRTESQQHARGLGEAIDRQFQRWGLSPAEREVALLLVKGLSHKEAAEVRATSERTVRQQALAVYRKAGLAGRAELAAFFLEDLLLPAPAAAEATPPAEGH